MGFVNFLNNRNSRKKEVAKYLKVCNILIFAFMLTVLLFSVGGNARASPPDEEWNLTYEVSGITSVESLQQTADSGYIIAGNTRSNAFVLKIGPTGSEQWNWTFAGALTNDRLKFLLQTSDGGYLIAGNNARLVKFNHEGQEQWNRGLTLQTPGGTGDDEIAFVRQTVDGGYFLIGNTDSHAAYSSIIWFVKVDSNGNMQWNNTFRGTGLDWASSVSQVPDGYIIAGGIKSYYWLVKTDTKGEVQWKHTFRGIICEGSEHSIQQTRDGGYIIAGITPSGVNHNDFLLVKTDSNGTEQWYRTFGGSGVEVNPSVRLSLEGGYILAGRTLSYDGTYWLIKTDKDGNMQWDRTFEGCGFQLTPDGSCIIKGDLYDSDNIKIDSNGNEQWNIRIEGNRLDYVLQTDDGGDILAGINDSKLLLIKLMAEGSVLTAQFTYDPGNPGANQTITFDASASHDPYGNIIYYQWDLGDGSYMNTAQRTVTHSYGKGGNYSVGLTVTGSNDDVSSITREIIVQRSAPPIMSWDKTFGGVGDDKAYSLAHTSDKGYILAGSSKNDLRLVKTDANGNMQWQRTIRGSGYNSGYSAMQTSDDGYIIAGNNFWLVKTDTEGIEQWSRTFRGKKFGSVSSVRQTSDGGYILAGSTKSYDVGSYDFWLVKTDEDGNMQWDRTFEGKGRDRLNSFQQTFDGGYVLAGYIRSNRTDSYDFWLVKTDQNGVELWNRTFGGNDRDFAYSVQLTSDGGYILTGTTRSFDADHNDLLIVKTDSNGNEQWNRTIVGPNGDNRLYSILQNPEGGYVIVGGTGSGGESYDVWLVGTDSDGYVQWQTTFGGTGHDVARSVLLALDGGWVVAGDKDWCTEQGTDFWLIKLGGIPAEPEDGGAPTDGEPVQTPDIPGFGAEVAVMCLLVCGDSLLRRRIY